MNFLAGPYKQEREAEKKAGVITGWAVYQSDDRDENDWNIVLTTTYKNMAALDNLRDRADPITKQVYGSFDKSDEAIETRPNAGHRGQPAAARVDVQVGVDRMRLSEGLRCPLHQLRRQGGWRGNQRNFLV
jgi:hypothetical protein